MNKQIECPECKKPVGEYRFLRSSNVPGLGAIPCYDMKYDYRKASRISFGRGMICKKCAKRFFPEGVAYKVTNNYHGKRITPYIGIKRAGLFSTREEAQKAADDCNRRNYDNYSKVDEIKL